MQESRLFRILYYLLDKGQATAPELAEKFEVSVRTIYRDIDAMSSAGIPIYVTTGRNGGIRFLDGHILDKTFFSSGEKQEILSAIQSLSAVQYPDIDNILRKLSAVFQTGLTDWIEIDFSRWGSAAEYENQLFIQLKQAVLEKRKIRFEYFNSSGTASIREALPQKLIYKDKAWYLHAYCLLHNGCRLFRFTRIKHLFLTETYFDAIPETDQNNFSQPQDTRPLINLELQFPPEVGFKLYDQLEDDAITQTQHGYTVNLTLPETDWIYDFLMSFGEKVTIIRPQYIKQKIIQKYEAALNHYKDT